MHLSFFLLPHIFIMISSKPNQNYIFASSLWQTAVKSATFGALRAGCQNKGEISQPVKLSRNGPPGSGWNAAPRPDPGVGRRGTGGLK